MIRRAISMSRSVRGRALDERSAPPELLAQFIDKIFPTVVTQVTVLPANQLPRISWTRSGIRANPDKQSPTDPDFLLDVSSSSDIDMPVSVLDPDISFNPLQCRVVPSKGGLFLKAATSHTQLNVT